MLSSYEAFRSDAEQAKLDREVVRLEMQEYLVHWYKCLSCREADYRASDPQRLNECKAVVR